MRENQPRILLAGMGLMLAAQLAVAGETYVSVGLGFASDKADVSTSGVNHPTRCDRLLYANPSTAPTGGACADNTARRFIGDSFDLGGGLASSIGVGYAWDRLRLEAEFLGRSHDGESLPAIADAGNPALRGKNSEWSDDSPPHHRVANFKVRQLFLNLYYSFGEASAWTPYVGVGAGFARVDTAYSASYLRRTAADGYVAAAGGDPMQPEEWQIAAAGSESRLDAELSGESFGYQIAAGIERRLAEKTRAFLTLRWNDFGTISKAATWSTIRSHAPVQADGVTPYITDQAFDNIGGLTATAGIRYTF